MFWFNIYTKVNIHRDAETKLNVTEEYGYFKGKKVW